MKIGLSILLFLLTIKQVHASSVTNDINVESNGGNNTINVENNVNSDSTTSVTSSSDSNTKVYIEQSGKGTSQVNVNGKEYKLEGPGKIDVTTSNTTNNTTITPKPTNQSESVSPTMNPKETETKINIIGQLTTSIKELIDKFFSVFIN